MTSHASRAAAANVTGITGTLGAASFSTSGGGNVVRADNDVYRHVQCGDADGDGLNDIFYAATGTWANSIIAASVDAYFVLAVDLDNDGDLDVVGGYSAYWANDGSGNFLPYSGVVLGSNANLHRDPSWIAAGDIDGDGGLDLMASY